MPDFPEELIRVNAILCEYVTIHDAIFKISWRRHSQFQDFSRPLTLGLTLETSVGWHPNWLLFHQH